MASSIASKRSRNPLLEQLWLTWLYLTGTRPYHIWSSPRKAHNKYAPAHEDFRVAGAHDAFGSLESKTRVDRKFKRVNPKTCNRLDLCLGPAYLYIKARRARRGGHLSYHRIHTSTPDCICAPL